MMADGWQAGDLALCVRWEAKDLPQIVVGGVYTVERLWTYYEEVDCKGLSFDFVEVPRPACNSSFDARCFRKIRPHTPDAEDAETIRLLNGIPAKELTT
jgi:hypothetical protein